MRWRLTAAFGGVVLVVVVALVVPLAGHLRRVERQRQLAELDYRALVIANAAAFALPEIGDPDAANSTLSGLASTVNGYGVAPRTVVVVGDDGVVVVAAGADPPAAGTDLSDNEAVQRALAQQETRIDAGGRVGVVLPVLAGSVSMGAVGVTTDESVVGAPANARVRGLLVVGGVSLAAAAAVALLLAATVTGPLRRLQRSTERVARGDFAARADAHAGPPEVRRVASSFNTMTERIARFIEHQQSFAGNASHQLRTPLTALRLQLERATSLVEHDPAGALDTLEAAGTEIERLQRLIDGLLVLARVDQDGTSPREPVDPVAVVAERIETWQQLAEEQGVRLTGTGQADRGRFRVLQAPGGLEQALDNYIDNALVVAPPGSTVEVVVDPPAPSPELGTTTVTVHVLDAGPGMPESHLTAAFERFWRAPDAPHDGSGLGLAIVANIAAASGGRARLARRPGVGIDAMLELPVGDRAGENTDWKRSGNASVTEHA